MSDETREALESVVGIVRRLEASARAAAVEAGAANDYQRVVRQGGRADAASEIARLIQDVIDER